jgi:hypothetical protein
MTADYNIPGFFKGRKVLLFLFLSWALVQSLLLLHYGIVTVLESHKYIEQADNLLQHGHVSTPNFWLYSVQIFLIALAKWLHAGYGLVVAVQLLLNGTATFLLYRLFNRYTDPLTSFILIFLFIVNIPYQSYNCFLFTESIFFSLTIIFSCYLFSLEKLSAKSILIITAFLVLLCVTRPTGLLLVPCAFLYLFNRFFKSMHVFVRLLLTAAVAFLFIVILNLFLGSGGEFDFILPFREEHIICGVPTVNTAGEITGYNNSAGGIARYIADHPSQFGRLAIARSLAFFGLQRSYYGTAHNVYLAVYFYPLYLFILFDIRNWWRKNKSLLIYALSCILITWIMVLLTCDDWHNRFFLVQVPFLYILSMPAAARLVHLIFHGGKK